MSQEPKQPQSQPPPVAKDYELTPSQLEGVSDIVSIAPDGTETHFFPKQARPANGDSQAAEWDPQTAEDMSRMPLTGDKPMLEEFEEAALLALSLGNDRPLKWLDREVYHRPDRLSCLTSLRLANPPKIKGLQQT